MSGFPPEVDPSGICVLQKETEAGKARSRSPGPRRMRGRGSSKTRPVRIVNQSFVGEGTGSRFAFGPRAERTEGASDGVSESGAGASVRADAWPHYSLQPDFPRTVKQSTR